MNTLKNKYDMNTFVFPFDDFDLINESLAIARKKYLDTGKIEQTDFADLTSVDKSPNHKTLPKMVDLFLAGATIEDIADVTNAFIMYSDSGYIQQKDINQYASIDELRNVIEAAKIAKDKKKGVVEEKKSEYTKMFDSGDADLVYNDKNISIVKPHSYDACKLFGKGSKWCITMDTDITHYTRHFKKNDETFYFLDIKGAEMREKLMMHCGYRISDDGTRLKLGIPTRWDKAAFSKIDTKLNDSKNPFKMYFITSDNRKSEIKIRRVSNSEYWVFELVEQLPTNYVKERPSGIGKIMDTSLFKLAVQVDKEGQLMNVWDGADYNHTAKPLLQYIGFDIDSVINQDIKDESDEEREARRGPRQDNAGNELE
jgi:hypothetical protein